MPARFGSQSGLPGHVVTDEDALLHAGVGAREGSGGRLLAAPRSLRALRVLITLGIGLALALAGLVPLLLRLDRQDPPVHVRLGAHLAD